MRTRTPALLLVLACAAAPSGAATFHGVALPDRAFSRTARIPDSLTAAIDATRSTLRLALYELTLPGVADALVRAKQRGVDVKLIYDQGHGGGTSSPQYQEVVSAGVETRLLKGGGSFGIMHNKVAVFDGELVETGSFNWTTAADQANFENALFRDDASLAALYGTYWDWMWALGTPVRAATAAHLLPSAAAAALAPDAAPGAGAPFGAPPSDPSPTVVYKGSSWPRACFSPNGGTEARLVEAIARSSRALDVAIFSLYSSAVSDAITAARGRGVVVRVVSDVSQSQRSPQVAALLNAGVDVRLSKGRGGRGVLHHKFALLDGEMLATGSFNFSENAEKNNFENQFYSADSGDLSAYQAEFEAVWAQAHVPAPGEVQGAASGVAAR